jgi:hypothetical protein
VQYEQILPLSQTTTRGDFFSVFWEFTVSQYYWPFLTFFLHYLLQIC